MIFTILKVLMLYVINLIMLIQQKQHMDSEINLSIIY